MNRLAWTAAAWFAALVCVGLAGFGPIGALIWVVAFVGWGSWHLARWAVQADRRERDEVRFLEVVRDL